MSPLSEGAKEVFNTAPRSTPLTAQHSPPHSTLSNNANSTCSWLTLHAGDDAIYKRAHLAPNIHEFANPWDQLSGKVQTFCNKVEPDKWAQHVHRAVLDGKTTENDCELMNQRWVHARNCSTSLGTMMSVVSTSARRWGNYKSAAHAICARARKFPKRIEDRIAAQTTRLAEYAKFEEPVRWADNSQLKAEVVCKSLPQVRFTCKATRGPNNSLGVECGCGYNERDRSICDCARLMIESGKVAVYQDAIPYRDTTVAWQAQYPLGAG